MANQKVAILNQMRANADLNDLMNQTIRRAMLETNCHAIATVQSFDSTKRTISATINYSQTVYSVDANGVNVPTQVDYPVLLDVPVIILGGGQSSLTFPISVGDECLILFNDRDIDNWVAGATSGPVATGRLHSFSDGIALVGFIKPSAYDTTRATLRNGTTYVGVGADKIKLANSLTTLNTLLQQLITDIKTLTTTNAVPGSPCTLSPASISALTTDATNIGNLLE